MAVNTRLGTMKAIIHIGTEKTGTTTIQEFLHQNRQELFESGIAYPKSPGLRNHRSLATACLNPDQKDDYAQDIGLNTPAQRTVWRQGFSKQLDTELRKLKKNCGLALFSSEHLQSRLTGIDEIKRFKALLSPHFAEMHLVLYLRRQDEVAVSRYSTALRAGYTPKSVIPTIKDPNHGFYNYLSLAKRWSQVFGEESLIVRVFSPEELVDGDLISDYCTTIGHSAAATMQRPERQNETLSALAQTALHLFNQAVKLCDDETHAPQKYTQLRRHIADFLTEQYPGKQLLPARDDAMAMYDIFRESNTELAKRFLGRETLFNEDFSSYPDKCYNPTLPPELITKLLAQTISHSG